VELSDIDLDAVSAGGKARPHPRAARGTVLPPGAPFDRSQPHTHLADGRVVLHAAPTAARAARAGG
jgi:hypothetical protein